MNLDTVCATPKSTVFGAKSVSWIRKVEEKSEALVVIEPMTFCSPRSRSNHRLLGHMWRATILHRTRWNNCNYHRKYISWFPCVETQTRLQKCPPPSYTWCCLEGLMIHQTFLVTKERWQGGEGKLGSALVIFVVKVVTHFQQFCPRLKVILASFIVTWNWSDKGYN